MPCFRRWLVLAALLLLPSSLASTRLNILNDVGNEAGWPGPTPLAGAIPPERNRRIGAPLRAVEKRPLRGCADDAASAGANRTPASIGSATS